MKRWTESELQSWGIAALRIVVGAVLAAHGAQKLMLYGVAGTAGMFGHLGIPFPMLSAFLSIGAELLGGIALMLGIFTRPVAAILAFNMAVAVFGVHLKAGFFLPTGFEYALTLLVANVSLALTGAGAFALDHFIQPARHAWGHGSTPAPLRS